MRYPYVSIDTETTGLDPETCQILEVGAVIDDWTTPFALLPKFRCYVNNGAIAGQPYALSMHPKILRAIATGRTEFSGHQHNENGGWREDEEVPIYHAGRVAYIFEEWLRSNRLQPSSKKLTVAGKNYGAFDHQFLKRLPQFTEYIKMQHRFIDPGNLYYDPSIDDGPPDTKECMVRAGIEGEVSHTAVEDAMTVVKLIRYWELTRG